MCWHPNDMILAYGMDDGHVGVWIDEPNTFNEVPLLLAVNKKRLDLVLLLLKYGANIYIESNNGLSPLTASKKIDNKIAAAIVLVDSIHKKLVEEFSVTLQFDLPRMIGITIFSDVSVSQKIKNLNNIGVKGNIINKFVDLCQQSVDDFSRTRDAFDLLYYKEEEQPFEQEENKIDVKSLEFLGLSIDRKNKYNIGMYGDVLRVRYKNHLVGMVSGVIKNYSSKI